MSEVNKEVEDLSNPNYRARRQHEFGRRLLSTLIDERAQHNHPRPFASIPYSANPRDGYRDISYRLFANTIDRCAWWIKQQLDLSNSFEPLIYVGAFDLRYQILAMAAVKTGHVMFFISPRNSLEAQLSLIDDAKVTYLLVSSGAAIDAMIQPILRHRALRRFVVPELEELLAIDRGVVPFEFSADFDDCRMKPWILLHTSGSTSSPKIVTVRHGYATSFDAFWLSANESDLLATLGQRRMFIPFPPFHMAGIVVNLACSVFVDATIVLPPAAAPLTAELVNDICLNARVEFANLPPFILMDMIKNPVYLQSLHGLKDLAYGGGPLPQETGDELNTFIGVTSFFGSTEACIIPSLLRSRRHWKYFRFDEKFAGIEFRSIENTKNLYELVFVRNPASSLVQAIFVTFPDINEYYTKDLFSKHHTEPELWRYEGRLDDIIVLSNAEKLNPISMEGTITSCPLVKGALVVGSGRFQPALLVEVNTPPELDQEKEKKKLLDSIWPYVYMANQQCPAYGRISQELIGFTPADKPFVRAGKGTIQRTPSLQLYAKEIDDLYARADDIQRQSGQIIHKGFKNVNEIQDFIHRWFLRSTRLGDLHHDQDFFGNGMDSLDVINLTRHINSAGQRISSKQVYNNPTIKQLALSLRDNENEQEDDASEDENTVAKMQQMFCRFRFTSKKPTPYARNTTKQAAATLKHVVLIGSTGSLGPYLLDRLLSDPMAAQITCLNRSADARSRQELKHAALGLITDFDKATFLKCDQAEPNLGLAEQDYEGILKTATHIVHNAWAVNFNQHVSSFEPLFGGVRNVIELTQACMPRPVRLFFMSSVSVADKLRVEPQTILLPEAPLDNWSLAKMGYGQSKLVAEALIADAVNRYGIDAAICRLCQLGGPVEKKGEWNRAEWIPSLIASSKVMGIVPDSLGPMDMVDWLPIDVVAKICLELLFHDVPDEGLEGQGHAHSGSGDAVTPDQHQVRVWHVVNPNPTLWSHLLPSIMASMPSTVKPVGFAQWVEQLENGDDSSSTKTAWDPDQVPSLKLISLYRYLRDQALKCPNARAVPVFDTAKTLGCSETLARMPAVNSAWTGLWMKQWETREESRDNFGY